MSTIEGLVKNEDLRKKLLFTLFALIIYRIGVQVPTPGVNNEAVQAFFGAQRTGIFGLFNTFTGGALERFSIFALGIMPYISSSIIVQLLTSAIPQLEQLKKEGSHGQKKINQYTRYGTVLLAFIQGYGISTWLLNSSSPDGTPLVPSPTVGPIPFVALTIITLTAGTCFIMWLGEQITERGIGNGASLIIFAGIAAGIPKGAMNTLELVRKGEMGVLIGLLLLAFMVLVIGFIIFMEVAQRRIPIQHSQRGGRLGGQTQHLPIKINFSGVIPPIFASSLLMLPATLAQFTQSEGLAALRDSFQPTGALYNVIFIALIAFFCFFYAEIVFKPDDVAENLKKSGGFIPGIRAGKSTSNYVQRILNRINVAGAAYLCAVCVLPTILVDTAKVPFYFGGTSLLILVGVAMDFTQQVQAHLLSAKYESFMRGATKMKSRRVQY
ncbi:MAG: preprotein translocase subunit SecY [Bdellovibrionales bacterium]|nr:preprotein translocase subunit SecY [Bdellovibrionales bacterium]